MRVRVSHVIGGSYLALRTLTGERSRARAAGTRSIPIFGFHRVSSRRPDHWMTIDPDRFGQLILRLSRRYRLVGLRELDEVLGSGINHQELLALTFDDAYGCNFEFAVPVLRELKAPATFFVSTGFIDSSEPFPHDARRGFTDLPNFTSAQVREMARDELFEFGSHTVTHADFSTLSDPNAIELELRESKRKLEELTGRAVERLAIPYGSRSHCTAAALEAARRCGYRRVYGYFGGRNAIDRDGHVGYVLSRMGELGGPRFLIAMIEGYRGWRSVLAPGRVVVPGPAFHPVVATEAL